MNEGTVRSSGSVRLQTSNHPAIPWMQTMYVILTLTSLSILSLQKVSVKGKGPSEQKILRMVAYFI